MTTKAIEGGARAELLPCPFCGGEAVRKHGYWIECASCEASIRAPRENITVDGATKKWNTRAIASGALVPASAGQRTPLDWGKLVQCILRVIDHPHKGENSTEQAERIATAIIGRFDTAPASGDYVVVPREAARDLWAIECGGDLVSIWLYEEHANKVLVSYQRSKPSGSWKVVRLVAAMLDAASRTGGGK